MTRFIHIKKPKHLFNLNLRVSIEKVTIYLFQNVNIREDINKIVNNTSKWRVERN